MNSFYVSSTVTQSAYFNEDLLGKSQKSKIMTSIASIAVVASSMISLGHLDVQSKIKIQTEQIFSQVSSIIKEVKVNELNFLNDVQKNDILNMNNEILEVDDLADKVTQTQLDEIKAHFDTKLSNVESNLNLKLDSKHQLIVSELKQFIAGENKEMKNNKIKNWQFWLAIIILPIFTTLLTIIVPIILAKI